MQVISFINMKGGVAKTTLCINVADFLARRKQKRVLVVDIDPQFNATQCLLSPTAYEKKLQAGQKSIVDVFDANAYPAVGAVSGAKTIQPTSLDDIKPIAIRTNFDLLPGNLNLYKLQMAAGGGTEHRLKKFLNLPMISAAYDYILIDTPPTPSVWMSSALLASDHYLIPVKPDPISFTGIDLLKRVVDDVTENYGTNLKCAGLVLTMAETNTIVYKACHSYLSKNDYWKEFLYKSNIRKATVVAGKQASQELILDTNDSDLKFDLASIVNELEQRLIAPKKKAKK